MVNNNTPSTAAITGCDALVAAPAARRRTLSPRGLTTGDTLVVNGTTFTFAAGSTSSGTNIGIGDNVTDLLSTINAAVATSVDLGRRDHHQHPARAGLHLSAARRWPSSACPRMTGDGLARARR